MERYETNLSSSQVASINKGAAYQPPSTEKIILNEQLTDVFVSAAPPWSMGEMGYLITDYIDQYTMTPAQRNSPDNVYKPNTGVNHDQ